MRNTALQKAERQAHQSPAPERCLPAGEIGLPPWVSTVSWKKTSDPKINLWRSTCPFALERLDTQLGTLPGADYSQQEQNAPLPSASPSFSPLEVESSVCQPQDVPIPGHPPYLDQKPGAGPTACRAGVG